MILRILAIFKDKNTEVSLTVTLITLIITKSKLKHQLNVENITQ